MVLKCCKPHSSCSAGGNTASLLKEAIKQNSFYVFCYESLNKISQRGQMDIHVRFLNENKIQARYFTAVFLSRARAESRLMACDFGTQRIR